MATRLKRDEDKTLGGSTPPPSATTMKHHEKPWGLALDCVQRPRGYQQGFLVTGGTDAQREAFLGTFATHCKVHLGFTHAVVLDASVYPSSESRSIDEAFKSLLTAVCVQTGYPKTLAEQQFWGEVLPLRIINRTLGHILKNASGRVLLAVKFPTWIFDNRMGEEISNLFYNLHAQKYETPFDKLTLAATFHDPTAPKFSRDLDSLRRISLTP